MWAKRGLQTCSPHLPARLHACTHLLGGLLWLQWTLIRVLQCPPDAGLLHHPRRRRAGEGAAARSARSGHTLFRGATLRQAAQRGGGRHSGRHWLPLYLVPTALGTAVRPPPHHHGAQPPHPSGQIVIENAQSMNQVQYIFMAVEGIVCCTLVTMFVAYTTSQVGGAVT